MAATVVEKAFCVLELAKTTPLLLYSVFSEDDMPNHHLQGSLSTTRARNFKKLVVYVKVKVLGDHQYQRTELDYRIDICRVTKGSHIEHL